MKRNTLFTLCAATVLASTTALGIVMAKPASRLGSVDWVGETSRDWNTASNWSGDAVPAATDVVIVDPPNPSLNYKGDPILSTGSDGLADDLTIGSGFSVTVTGNTLILDGAVTHDFDGDLFLTNGSSILKFVDNSATVNGDGAIVGQDSNAKIQIEGGDTLTSTMIIRGKMIIETDGGTGNGTFHNGSTGHVQADVGGGILTFASGLDITDGGSCSTAVFAATVNNAKMLFNQSATGLTALFYLNNCAVIEVGENIDIATTNTFTNGAGGAPKGCLVVGSGGSFKYATTTCGGSQTTRTVDHTFGDCDCS